ncbi:FAD-dependent oxidoreductase [Nocardia thailandica]|uniref:FAD-dependent oxidoreductase n=1 Tax=Nocardia thailandica TaxID=257275 RepID=A0ABW6PXK1_9NOCA
MEHTRCVVVGGGPAGMMTGLLLARAGVEVTVLEKHGDFLRDFRGDTVHPSTLRLLDELGLGDRFAALEQRSLTRMRMIVAGQTIVAADFTRIPGRHKRIAMVPQWDFLTMLAEAARAEPTFTLRMSTAATAPIVTDGVVRGVRVQGPDGPGELRADLVIACDGRDSVIRAGAGLRQRAFDVPMDVWWVRVPAPPDRAGGGEVFGRFEAGAVAVTMDRGDYLQTSYLIPKGADARFRAAGLDRLRGQLHALFGWDAATLDAIASWDDVKLLEVTMGRLDRWHTPGLLCLGDAAHTMSPVGGVGVNLAIQDAVAAARILAEPLRRGPVPERVLARVRRRRHFPTAVTQRSQLGEHATLLEPALAGTLTRVPAPLRVVGRVPALAGLAAYVGGVGVRPEHAPAFARRP